jgi:hypothetical protein
MSRKDIVFLWLAVVAVYAALAMQIVLTFAGGVGCCRTCRENAAKLDAVVGYFALDDEDLGLRDGR